MHKMINGISYREMHRHCIMNEIDNCDCAMYFENWSKSAIRMAKIWYEGFKSAIRSRFYAFFVQCREYSVGWCSLTKDGLLFWPQMTSPNMKHSSLAVHLAQCFRTVSWITESLFWCHFPQWRQGRANTRHISQPSQTLVKRALQRVRALRLGGSWIEFCKFSLTTWLSLITAGCNARQALAQYRHIHYEVAAEQESN